MLQLQNLLSVPESFVNLKLELAVTIDVGEHFVKATYFLAGDGPFVFSCYEKLKAVAKACQAVVASCVINNGFTTVGEQGREILSLPTFLY